VGGEAREALGATQLPREQGVGDGMAQKTATKAMSISLIATNGSSTPPSP
jgi:hypothetical protein